MALESLSKSRTDSLLLNAAQILDSVEGAELLFAPLSSVLRRGFTLAVTDSRNVEPGALFVPLVGEFRDGHDFIEEASNAGASVVFVEKTRAAEKAHLLRGLYEKNGTLFFAVNSTLSAFQDAAAGYVSLFPGLLKVAVTGSSGKTTVKEMIAAIFSQKYKTVKNEGNLNSETGLPLSVFNIRREHEAGVFELGMNKKNEISSLARVLCPSLALITNIGNAHIGILGSREAIAREKKSVFAFFDSSCVGFVLASDDFAEFLSDIPKGRVFFFGSKRKDRAVDFGAESGITEAEDRDLEGFRIRYEGVDIFLPLAGNFNLKNAVGAIALARYAGFSAADIKSGLESVKSPPARCEILRLGDEYNPLTVIKDCYNANPDSMARALEFASSLPRRGRLILALGSMLELGKASEDAHKRTIESALSSGASALFLFGKEMQNAWLALSAAVKSASSRRLPCVFLPESIKSLSESLGEFASGGDIVLLKGSRAMALERVLPALEGFMERAYSQAAAGGRSV